MNHAQQSEARHLLQVYAQLPIEVDSAEGVYLHSGARRIIDFYGGHAVAALGYAHPDLLAALRRQAQDMYFQSNAVALEVRAQAADALVGIAPAGLSRVFFANSGAEANENALRIACRTTGRARILALEHGFHGRTAASAAVTWGAAKSWYGFPRAPFDVDFIPRDDIARAEAMIDGETAAVILEVVQGLAGAYDLDPAFVTAIAAACRRHGALLIVDEVQSGVGRTGAAFAAELYGLQPDMLTTAKALGGGFPCSALLLTEELAARLKSGDLGTTFGGGPMACALVSTVIEVIRRDRLLENVRTLSAELQKAAVTGPVTAVQGRGFLLGLRCKRPAKDVQAALLARDILVGTSSDPAVVRLLPPLTLERQHVQTLCAALADIG
ncbi:MAG: aminotransferase class III-fold pyridoxal phosphate-dependent enzyme [Gammaproteobacteria bacterium]|jgi:acetylornithine/succinyldiaminopimelate/putrescine aminotransferase|nr:aminotransferase class III-fold pyridoxal phosphate-dependent enzyme [Gammaproteobacteria bacterium]